MNSTLKICWVTVRWNKTTQPWWNHTEVHPNYLENPAAAIPLHMELKSVPTNAIWFVTTLWRILFCTLWNIFAAPCVIASILLWKFLAQILSRIFQWFCKRSNQDTTCEAIAIQENSKPLANIKSEIWNLTQDCAESIIRPLLIESSSIVTLTL